MIELKYILRNLRENKQVSMDKMCQDLSVLYNAPLAKSTISKWENGKAEPSLSYARILTKYFNVTLDYLLGLEKDESYSFSKNLNTLSKIEEILLSNFNSLNDLGKREANKRVSELTEINKYKYTEEYTLAAHDDGLDEETSKRTLEKAKAIFKQMDEE
jgi:transcriptional regulator with XRE-family HTH domain